MEEILDYLLGINIAHHCASSTFSSACLHTSFLFALDLVLKPPSISSQLPRVGSGVDRDGEPRCDAVKEGDFYSQRVQLVAMLSQSTTPTTATCTMYSENCYSTRMDVLIKISKSTW